MWAMLRGWSWNQPWSCAVGAAATTGPAESSMRSRSTSHVTVDLTGLDNVTFNIYILPVMRSLVCSLACSLALPARFASEKRAYTLGDGLILIIAHAEDLVEAQALKAEDPGRVMVSDVDADSSADRAGIRAGA